MAQATQWTPNQAWEHLVTNVLQSPHALNSFAYAVGCTDIDDFMYLKQTDFESPFEISSQDEGGNTVSTTQVLSRVLVNKLLRAQRWFDAQMICDYDTWSNLTISVLNDFKEGANMVTPTSPGTDKAIPTTPITPLSFNYGSNKQESTSRLSPSLSNAP